MGPDEIGNWILKYCSYTLCQSLATPSQTCLNKDKYPTIWKTCQVTPFFEEGNKVDVKCYRNISLLFCCSNVYEKVMFDALYETVKDRLHASQYGFRKKCSATLQHLTFLDRLCELNDTDSQQQLCVLYIDFAKAFDSVPHNFLIKKWLFSNWLKAAEDVCLLFDRHNQIC